MPPIEYEIVNQYADETYASEETLANVESSLDALGDDGYVVVGMNDRIILLAREVDAAQPAT